MEIYAEPAVGNTENLPYGEDTLQIVDGAMGGVIAYCHRDSAGRIVEALRASASRTVIASTLGQLIDALETCDPDAVVEGQYKDELVTLGKPSFYRGYHCDLAFSPEGIGPATVVETIRALRGIIHAGFTRPGGHQEADESTRVWIARYRDASHQQVSGIRVEGDKVVILTEKRPG
jgi:hypothetical protein